MRSAASDEEQRTLRWLGFGCGAGGLFASALALTLALCAWRLLSAAFFDA